MKIEWTRRAMVLHGQLLAEAIAAKPRTGARRATEKAEYCRALRVVAARVREWLQEEERTIEGFAYVMVRMETDLAAAVGAMLTGSDGKQRGWCCGLCRAGALMVETWEKVAVELEEGGSTGEIPPAPVGGVVTFRVELRDPEAEAERLFFEEADRVLGRGGG